MAAADETREHAYQHDVGGVSPLAHSAGSENTSACIPSISKAPRKSRRMGGWRFSGTCDSKHTEAAALALSLSSESSWSERFMPNTSPSSNPISSHSPEQSIPESMASIDSHSCVHTSRSFERIDLGPPPEYSPAHEHDLSPDIEYHESDIMHQPRSIRHVSNADHQQQSSEGSNHCRSVEEPLLKDQDEGNEKLPEGRFAWMQSDGIASFRRRRSYCFYVVLGISLLAAVVGGIFAYIHVVSGKQPENWPFIPTDRVHVHHDPYESIRGRFELYDRLDLSTTTGDIDIQIDLQPGNETAELILSSSTGSIRLSVSDTWWSRKERSYRPIRTEIKTVTGSVWGRILLGNGGYTSVETVSGAQDLWLYVYNAEKDDKASHLITRSHIGHQTVAVTNFNGYESKIENLYAQHDSLGTADLDLQYSHAWRGEVSAETTPVAKLDVQDSMGMIFDKEEDHRVLAHKGKSEHPATVNIVGHGTGSVTFASWYTW